MNAGRKIIGAAVVGAAVGAAAVMLKDKKNQEKVKKSVKGAIDKGMEFKEKVEEQGKKIQQRARVKADDISEKELNEIEEDIKKSVYEPLEKEISK